jgi:hypothetical protein
MISYAFLTWIIETVVCPTISMEDPAILNPPATCLGNFGDLRFGSGEVLNDQYFPTADLAG